MKVKDLINYINTNKFYSLQDMEDSLQYDLKEFPKRVAKNLEIDKHRWYEVSTSVYKLEDGFVGIKGVSNIYTKNMDAENCCFECSANEYKEIQSISYKRKV